jgi:hypothetical protein
VAIYGKRVTVDAYVGVVMPSRRLGNEGIRVVIFPQRSGCKMNIFFTTDLTMAPERLLELYAARFKIEDCFDELKTVGGFAASNSHFDLSAGVGGESNFESVEHKIEEVCPARKTDVTRQSAEIIKERFPTDQRLPYQAIFGI